MKNKMQSLGKLIGRILAWPFQMLIRFYQYVISPWIGPSCRFTPTCSSYMSQAITRHGLLRGLVLGVSRLMRCHPWGASGYDPVPDVWQWRFLRLRKTSENVTHTHQKNCKN